MNSKVCMSVAIIAAFVMIACGKDVKCQSFVTDPNTGEVYYYDLSSLHHDESVYVDTLWYRLDNNDIYFVNFCGQTASACAEDDTSVCVRIPDGEDYKYVSGGSTSTQKVTASDRRDYPSPNTVMVTYSHGVKCGSGTYTTKIYITCQQGATPGFFYNFENSSFCEGSLFMYSAAGCPTNPHGSSSSSSPVPPKPTNCQGQLVQAGRVYDFDLSMLHHDASTYVDTLWYRTDNNDIYYVNFCGQTASACEADDTSVCIRTADGSDYKYISGGSTSTQAFSPTKGSSIQNSITVTYSNGEKCSSGRKKTNLVVNCQPTATPGFFYNIDEINDCEATLYMYSAAGCGKKE